MARTDSLIREGLVLVFALALATGCGEPLNEGSTRRSGPRGGQGSSSSVSPERSNPAPPSTTGASSAECAPDDPQQREAARSSALGQFLIQLRTETPELATAFVVPPTPESFLDDAKGYLRGRVTGVALSDVRPFEPATVPEIEGAPPPRFTQVGLNLKVEVTGSGGVDNVASGNAVTAYFRTWSGVMGDQYADAAAATGIEQSRALVPPLQNLVSQGLQLVLGVDGVQAGRVQGVSYSQTILIDTEEARASNALTLPAPGWCGLTQPDEIEQYVAAQVDG